jgi:hypothetical protein
MEMPRLSDLTRDQLSYRRSLDYSRWIAARIETGGAGPAAAAARYLDKWPRSISQDLVRKALTLDTQELDLADKAAVAIGNTTDAAWAGALVTPKELRDAFLTIVRPQEIPSQLPGIRHVPLATPVPTWNPNSPSSATWIGQGVLKPITQFAFGSATVTPAKVQCGCALTRELLEFGMPDSDLAIRDVLAFQVVTGVNEEFILPARAAVANERPGSVTNAGTLVTTANDPVVDAKAVLTALQVARPTATPVLIMDGTAASALIATDKHRDLTLTGGIAFGAKTLVVPAAGKTIAAIDPSAVLLSDLSVEFDTSRHASIVLDSTPAAVPDEEKVYVSLFQRNLIGLRAERFISWKLTAAVACQYTTRA